MSKRAHQFPKGTAALAIAALCAGALPAHADSGVEQAGLRLPNQSRIPAPVASAAQQARAASITWRVEKEDRTLKGLLSRWSDSAGWQLVWELPVDYELHARAQVSGGFEDAVAAIATSLQNSDAPIKAIFYRGNNVLRVVAKGAQ
jgi:hypothetical protein